MNLCELNHDEVCYETRECPACLLVKETENLSAQLQELETTCEQLRAEVKELEVTREQLRETNE